MALPEENTTEKKRGNPGWTPGVSANPAGRPKVLDKDKKTNKALRASELMSLARRLKPHLSRAIMAAADVLENKESADASKLKASALIMAAVS